jgi:hypothetical protein
LFTCGSLLRHGASTWAESKVLSNMSFHNALLLLTRTPKYKNSQNYQPSNKKFKIHLDIIYKRCYLFKKIFKTDWWVIAKLAENINNNGEIV